MGEYSAWSLIRGGLNGQRHWRPAWHERAPAASYDVIIVGGGGHGLATAYYLAAEHGIRRVAVIERGWIGGGNTGRNTSVIRSNYFFPQSAAFYDFSVKLYEGLSKTLNYNIMFSQRGQWVLAHDRHGEDVLRRSVNAMLSNGIHSEYYDAADVHKRIPGLNRQPRFPIRAGLLQPRAGTARHDAVAWGYARGADRLGVDIIQNCGVQSFVMDGNRIAGVRTDRGDILSDRIGLAVAGHSGVLAGLAGFRLPMTSYQLQAMVSEPLKPVLDTVIIAPGTGVYVNQSDKGEIVVGSSLDLYPSYAQRGGLPILEYTMAGLLDLFPQFSRVRLLRQWAGIVDVVHDSTPILGASPVDGLYLNCGWGTGGFKAIPAGGYCMAHHIATGHPHPLARDFGLERFTSGALIDEAAASAIAH